MKRQWLFLVAALFFVVAAGTVPAVAVEIGNLSGQSCGDGTGTWHFVNNQTGTTVPGTLTATWSSGDTCVTGPSKVTPNGTQHFLCSASGELTSASTNLNGKLVLSDFSCDAKKPPCDPKTDPNCKP